MITLHGLVVTSGYFLCSITVVIVPCFALFFPLFCLLVVIRVAGVIFVVNFVKNEKRFK